MTPSHSARSVPSHAGHNQARLPQPAGEAARTGRSRTPKAHFLGGKAGAGYAVYAGSCMFYSKKRQGCKFPMKSGCLGQAVRRPPWPPSSAAESLPLPGARPGGAREGGMCTCLEADDVSAHARGPGTGPPVPTASLVQRLTAVLKKRKSSCHSNEG